MWKSKRIDICLLIVCFSWYNKFKEQNDWIEKTDNAYQLQIKAQKTAEEAMSHLQFYMTEPENLVFKYQKLQFLQFIYL